MDKVLSQKSAVHYLHAPIDPFDQRMIEVGEETGALPEMLDRIAKTYEEEVDNAVEAMTALIEPAMIVFLAIVIGGIVIALFLPLIKLIEQLGG